MSAAARKPEKVSPWTVGRPVSFDRSSRAPGDARLPSLSKERIGWQTNGAVVQIFAVAMLLTLVAASACGQSNEPTAVAQTGLADPNVRAELRTMALQASSANGVPSPKTIEAVASPDHQAAEKIVSGAIVNDHVAVYVVEVTGGTFTDNTASTPPGVPAPSGSVLTLTVDAQSFRVTDFGLTDTAPDLTQIGPVVNLDQ
jgi:hypothetical protein